MAHITTIVALDNTTTTTYADIQTMAGPLPQQDEALSVQ